MKTITSKNPKGGTGKSTAAMLLAMAIAEAGGKVAVLDLDPNENIVAWSAMRLEEGRGVPFGIFQRPARDEDVVDLIDSIEAQGFDYLIIDLEGSKDQIGTFALSRTDLAMIPMDGSFMEARQAAEAIRLIEAAEKMIRTRIPYTMLFTRTNAAFQTSDEREVREEMEGAGTPTLPVRLAKRAPFTRIFRDSLLLSELPGIVAQETEGKAVSARTKAAEQVSKAIENANEFAQAVINRLETGEAVQ